jgi:hypothetical protein
MDTSQTGYRETVARLVTGAAIVFVLATATAAATTGVHISPTSGVPSTTFTVSFVVPTQTGVRGSVRTKDEVTASASATAGGCTGSTLEVAPVAARGSLVHVSLRPSRGEHWCAGTFTGKVLELQTPVCPPRSLCPMYERLRTLGTFSFSVHRS